MVLFSTALNAFLRHILLTSSFYALWRHIILKSSFDACWSNLTTSFDAFWRHLIPTSSLDSLHPVEEQTGVPQLSSRVVDMLHLENRERMNFACLSAVEPGLWTLAAVLAKLVADKWD